MTSSHYFISAGTCFCRNNCLHLSIFDLIWVWMAAYLYVFLSVTYAWQNLSPLSDPPSWDVFALKSRVPPTRTQRVPQAADADPIESLRELCGHIYPLHCSWCSEDFIRSVKKPQHQRLWLVLASQWKFQCRGESSSLYTEVMKQDYEILPL